ncbi:metal-dependent hydrolase [Thermococci archaeon]|nr:MAG: metal-dependent hydrolase [Thermococci archaeon]
MNYEEHVLVGLITYPLFVALVYFLRDVLNLKLTFLSLALGYAFYVLGSDLPDIDHPDSIIHRGIKPIFSVILGSVVAYRIQAYIPSDYSLIYAWGVGGIFAVLGWYFFTLLMPRHRGIVHSLTFATLYGLLTFLGVRYGISLTSGEAYLIGLAAFSGYLLHLILDKSIKLL